VRDICRCAVRVHKLSHKIPKRILLLLLGRRCRKPSISLLCFLRPPGYVEMFCSCPFSTIRTTRPRPRSDAPAKVYQILNPRLNLINSLRHFAHPTPKFYKGKCRNLASIFDHSRPIMSEGFARVLFQPLEQPWPRPAKVYQILSPRLNLINLLRHFAHPSPKFYVGKVRNLASVFDHNRL